MKRKRKKVIVQMDKRFLCFAMLKFLVLDFIVSYLFYDSWILFILLSPLFLVYIKNERRLHASALMKSHKLEFREAMISLYGLVASGYSLDSAIKSVPDELRLCYSSDCWIVQAFEQMSKELHMNTSALNCLEKFAQTSGDDDIMSFYEVISIAKRYGGGMAPVIKAAIDRISQRIESECEIQTLIAGRKKEFTVMAMIPAGIICYMRISSAEMMAVLYTFVAGRIVMTVCLCVYIAAVIWGYVMIKKAVSVI